jgi:hypothetical protein
MSEAIGFSWRLFWILFAAAILGVIAFVPAALDIFGPVLRSAQRPAIPLPLLIALGAIQNLTLIGLLVGVVISHL